MQILVVNNCFDWNFPWMDVKHIAYDGSKTYGSSRPLTRDKASVAVVLFMTCLILFDDHDRVFTLLFSPTFNITYRPALDAPSGKFAYDASVKATILRSSTVPKSGNTSFDSLFLIFWIILFASIK